WIEMRMTGLPVGTSTGPVAVSWRQEVPRRRRRKPLITPALIGANLTRLRVSPAQDPSLPQPLSPIALPPTGREGSAKKGGLALDRGNRSWLFSLFSRSGGGRWE